MRLQISNYPSPSPLYINTKKKVHVLMERAFHRLFPKLSTPYPVADDSAAGGGEKREIDTIRVSS